MHGAGMVNVLWTRPHTQVIEIFPKKRYRWGYRNLCQFVGCEWRQFRGGVDTGNGDNASDKKILYLQWRRYFEPIYAKMIQQFQKNQFIHYIEQLSAKNDTAPIATTNLSNNGLNRK
jgi:protein O-GlcNAc transferase